LVPASTLRLIGLPDTTFYLYEDDTEFTNRIRRSGGRLMLCREAIIQDGDVSWSLKDPGRGLDALLTATTPGRMLYAIRNRAYFDSRWYAESSGRLLVNRWAFKALLIWRGYRLDRRERVGSMLSALAAGERGELGPQEEAA
jgi:hypothetical protein